MKSIAIIGSGPSGCYLADALVRLAPDAAVDIIERMPVPFGLVRYGVAPDHQGTKAIARVFDKILAKDRVSFFGNVEVGRDVPLDELLSMYDAVVIATGAPSDRHLGIAGEELPGVITSGELTSWYNGHPDFPVPPLRDIRSAVVIGNGNVALDVARMLAKGEPEFKGGDLPMEAKALFTAQPLQTVHVVGRRGPADAKFAKFDLGEFGKLGRARAIVENPEQLVGDFPLLETFRGFGPASNPDAAIEVIFHFHLTPEAFIGEDRLTGVRFRTADGTTRDLDAQLAVTCIGHESVSLCDVAPVKGLFVNTEGKISDQLFVTGWAKRGPSGTIPTNRVDAQQVAQQIVGGMGDSDRGGTAELRRLLRERQVRWVDYEGWKRIDAAELAGAGDEYSRRKLLSIAEMLEVACPQQVKAAQ